MGMILFKLKVCKLKYGELKSKPQYHAFLKIYLKETLYFHFLRIDTENYFKL